MPSILVNILLFILVIGVLTFVHELGHFIVAKLVGARVFEFALGFGPKLLSKNFRGTLYSIRLFPLGGFVKILGDGDPGVEENRGSEGDLSKKSKIKQIFVMLAGVSMNVLLAVLFYYIVLGSNGWKVYLSPEFESFNAYGGRISRESYGVVEYSSLLEEGNAKRAGLPSSGSIVSINGDTILYSDEVGKSLVNLKGKSVLMSVCSNTVCDDYNVDVSSEGKIGITLKSNYLVSLSYEGSEYFAGFVHVVNNLRLIGIKLGDLISTARDTGDYSELSNSVSGPVGIYFVIDYFKDFGIVAFLSVIADLSLSLAFVNLLPIPALDGGRFFILLIEGVLRKDLNERLETLIINISFFLLIILIILVFIKDIVNIDSIRNMFM